MDIAGRSILIAGGTSGIGLGLARRLRDAGASVIVGGRRIELFEKLEAEGFGTVELDVTDQASVDRARDHVLGVHPDLDVVVAMAGLVIPEDLRDPRHLDDAELMIATNLLGTIRLIDAFTQHLLHRRGGVIVTVSSAGAFVPLASLPTYAATKAGIHVYSEALRAQLDGTGVEVVELIPPPVTTDLERVAAGVLSQDAFLDEVLEKITLVPTPSEIVVEDALRYRWAERDGNYAAFFAERSAQARTILSTAIALNDPSPH